MRKGIVLFLFLITALGGCGKTSRYSEVVNHIDEIIEYQYTYIEKLNKANNGAEVAAAIDDYVDKMLLFSERWKGLTKKYPVLKSDKLPPELEKQLKRLDETVKIVEERVSTPLNRFILEPPVLKAFQRMTEKMSNIEIRAGGK